MDVRRPSLGRSLKGRPRFVLQSCLAAGILVFGYTLLSSLANPMSRQGVEG